MNNMAVWFEIPVENMNRAISFYSKVFEAELEEMVGSPKKYATFPHVPGVVSGALIEDPGMISEKGSLIYLNGGDDLAVPLSRVVVAGGEVLQEKTSIGEYGFMAIFKDTEGNRVALHSMK